MDRKGSAPIILLIVLILIFLALASGGFYLFQKERVRNLELQDTMEEIKTKQRITESKLRESEKVVADLQARLREAKSQVDSLTNELKQEKQTRVETQARLEQFSADLEQQKELRADLEKRLAQAQEETRTVQQQLKEFGSQKQELEAKIKDLEQKTQNIELGKIVVAPPEPVPAPVVPVRAKEKRQPAAAAQKASQQREAAAPVVTGPQGKVLIINKEYNFVVINLGSRDGIEAGAVFSIYRGNKYVGDIRVEKVHDAMSAAGFITDGVKDKVNEGDRVIQKAK